MVNSLNTDLSLVNRYSGVACKKVYFLWICQSHRQFEWFIDVLREVEKKDVTNVLEIHIFITQFFHKFDLRTTMLVIRIHLLILHTFSWMNFSVHLRESLPEAFKEKSLYRFKGQQPLWSSRYVSFS